MSKGKQSGTQQIVTLTHSLAELSLIVILIGAFIIVASTVYVVHTFAHFPKNKALWITLTLWAVLTVAGVALTWLFARSINLVLPLLGTIVLLITCLSVQLRGSASLIPEQPQNLIATILHSNWWDKGNAPHLQEEDDDENAA